MSYKKLWQECRSGDQASRLFREVHPKIEDAIRRGNTSLCIPLRPSETFFEAFSKVCHEKGLKVTLFQEPENQSPMIIKPLGASYIEIFGWAE